MKKEIGEDTVGQNRVNRGGSWINDADNCRVSNRNNWNPTNRNDNIGFRLVLAPAHGAIPILVDAGHGYKLTEQVLLLLPLGQKSAVILQVALVLVAVICESSRAAFLGLENR